MSYDLVIKGGLVVAAGGSEPADVAVSGERIAAIGLELDGANEIDATGCYVLPGAIDGHVHLSDPRSASIPTADTVATGTRAAAFGGVTTVVDFAESQPDEPLSESLMRRREDAEREACVDFGLHMIIRHATPSHLSGIPELVDLGVPSFKLFMAWADYRLTDVELLRAMETVASSDGLAIVHAENEDVIEERKQRLQAMGKVGARWHPKTSPPITESEAVHRALALAALAGVRTLIFHVSSGDGLRELVHAKARRQAAYGEVCVQYLVLTDELYQRDDDYAHSLMVRPPIRDRIHQDALWEGLADGGLDIVSTDHGPRTARPDAGPHPSGTSSIETRVSLLHEFGVRTGRISLERWVEVCAERPAEIFGLARKGRLAPGYDADIVVFDPQRTIALSAPTLHSAIDYSTYEGITVTGAPTVTISRGQVLVENERFVGPTAHGRFVERSYEPITNAPAKEAQCSPS